MPLCICLFFVGFCEILHKDSTAAQSMSHLCNIHQIHVYEGRTVKSNTSIKYATIHETIIIKKKYIHNLKSPCLHIQVKEYIFNFIRL